MATHLPGWRQNDADQLLAVLPRSQIDALEEFLEGQEISALARIIYHSQQDHLTAH
jgi:hypothetical protein